MATDFTLLSKKLIFNWRDLEALLFAHALENTPRNFQQDTKFKKLQQTQHDFGEWILSTMDSGELDAIQWGRDPVKGVPGLEINKGVLCYWLFEKDVLGWLEEREVQVRNDTIKFIKSEAEKKAIEATAKTEPTQPEPEAKPKKKRDDKFSRSDPNGKMQDAIRKLLKAGVRENIIPFKPEILAARGKKDDVIDKQKDYKKQVGVKLSTVQTMTRKLSKEIPKE